MTKAKVYFTKEITPQSLIAIYKALGVELSGKVGVKISTGEPGVQNFLNPNRINERGQELKGTIVECNTAYGDAAGGVRDNTPAHLQLLDEHGWTKYFDVDLMDAEGPDVVWPRPNGNILTENRSG